MDPFCTVAVGKERSRTRNVDRGEMVYSWRDEPMSVPVEADYVHSRAEIGCHERLGHYFHANIGEQRHLVIWAQYVRSRTWGGVGRERLLECVLVSKVPSLCRCYRLNPLLFIP